MKLGIASGLVGRVLPARLEMRGQRLPAGIEGLKHLLEYAFRIETKVMALGVSGSVLNEGIGHADAMYGNALKVSLRQHFKHGRAEPASEDVLLDRNDAASLSRRIKQQFQVERLHEERIDDAAVDTESRQVSRPRQGPLPRACPRRI